MAVFGGVKGVKGVKEVKERMFLWGIKEQDVREQFAYIAIVL